MPSTSNTYLSGQYGRYLADMRRECDSTVFGQLTKTPSLDVHAERQTQQPKEKPEQSLDLSELLEYGVMRGPNYYTLVDGKGRIALHWDRSDSPIAVISKEKIEYQQLGAIEDISEQMEEFAKKINRPIEKVETIDLSKGHNKGNFSSYADRTNWFVKTKVKEPLEPTPTIQRMVLNGTEYEMGTLGWTQLRPSRGLNFNA